MTIPFRPLLRFTLAAILGFTTGFQPLYAQLDTRLQGSRTDYLDLFQQSVNLVMKPEVVSIFDFSGSMAAVMYHRQYVYPVNTDTSDGGGGAGMRFTLTSPAAGRYNVTVSLATTTALSNGKLVRPDGSLLEYASNGDTAINTNYVASGLPGETASPKASDVRNWIRSASHVRFTSGGKTYDLPICWTILDDPSVLPNAAAGQFRKMYNTYPLKMTIINPATNNEIEMDSSYRVAAQGANVTFGMFSSTTGSAPMTACTLGSQYYFIYWKSAYITWLFNTATSVIQSTSAGGKAFAQSINPDPAIAANAIPARTRTQGVKDAAMRTWAKYHNKVFWAYRFLKYYAPDSDTSQTDSAVYPSNDSRGNKNVSDPTITGRYGQSDRGWTLLTGNSDSGLKRLAALMAMGSTTLNSALANTYAQLNDPNCILNDVETGVDKPVECRNTYVMLFTDGVPNTDPGTPDNTNTPYIGLEPAPATATYGTAKTGNLFFAANKTRINTTNSTPYFNVINLAALAAHGGDTDNGGWVVPTYPTTTQTYPSPGSTWKPSDWIPFWIRSRGAGLELVTFDKPRPITTMTIGVSLTGVVNNTAHPKRRLFLAAAFGDPVRKTWDVASLTEFTLKNPAVPSEGKTADSTYFFDATDPNKLTNSLDAAFAELTLQSNINVNANPNLPYIGATFGKQVYIGKFQPPKTGGTIWDGDLLAFTTRETATGIDFLDAGGNPTTTLDETTGIWSAKKYFTTPLTSGGPNFWSARKLFTRIPGTSSVPEPGLTIFSDLDPAYSIIKPYTATALAADADKKKVIQFVAGGDIAGTLDASLRPITNRKTIMGDIVNSSPVALEYTWPTWFTVPATTPSVSAPNRFRLILAGTNQGWLHAFGEVSKVTTVTDAAGNPQEVVQGGIAELWSFLPTDFLKKLDYVSQTNNPHRFLVDGTPTIYHLDIPPTTGAAANGTVDSGERAMVIIGLRKGGRSYYALDVSNPMNPVLKWSLVPDETALYSFPASRIEAGGPNPALVTTVVKAMGYSTATPSIGRMMFDGILRDVVFFSGGLGLPEIESNFLAEAPNGMGRSVLALDVNTGKVLAAVNMSTISSSIPAGVVPFEFILNSGMAQRAYFLDYGGSLWAWGSRELSDTTPYKQHRIDTSDLAYWANDSGTGGVTRSFLDISGSNAGIRKVAKDGSGTNAKYTTLPAPFRVGSFPGAGATVAGAAQAPPAAVGVAMVSGDRNNPLDDYNANPTARPTGHRLTVVFDRQDSKAWLGGSLDTSGILDTNLKNFTSQNNPTAPEISPGNASYYLAPTGTPFFGYYVDFPAAVAPFISKGISEPMVVAGSLFYTYFNPTDADPCVGGGGTSYSRRICDVINPIVTDSRTGLGCTSGQVATFTGVATAYLAYGTRGVIQAGATPSGVVTPSGSTTTPKIERFTGRQQERFPKPRVWRTVR